MSASTVGTHMGLLAFQYMSARRMQATSHDSVSKRVSRITTIIHGMVRQKQIRRLLAENGRENSLHVSRPRQ
ncbi:hypothetical protein CDAR_611671 [Caerostris darwini]|uniref:Uncharacterized protein n=1 Tax=Caerostris darwini TaxID=1538125 RepID=A0AAV4U335_9ARAC|nr:hypothetical protein CDAR_611671 [Caerostris darwini]